MLRFLFLVCVFIFMLFLAEADEEELADDGTIGGESGEENSTKENQMNCRYKWERKQNMAVDSFTFLSRMKHEIYYDEEKNQIHVSAALAKLKMNSIQGWRVMPSLKILTYVEGDGFTVHQINPVTKIYSKTDVGPKVGRFYTIVPEENWYVVDLQEKEATVFIQKTFAIVGMNMVYRRGSNTTPVWGDRSSLLQTFPEHSQIISKYTPTPDEEDK